MLGETLMGAVGSGTDKTTELSALQLCGVRDRHSPSLVLSGHEVRGFCRLQRVKRGRVR